MSNDPISMTVLTAVDSYASACKDIVADKDGKIEKKFKSVGVNFKFRKETFGNIRELGEVIKRVKKEPNSFPIRGAPIGNASEPVIRKLAENGGYFRDDSIRWMMADFDKLKNFSPFIDPAVNPEAGAAWARCLMGEAFDGVTCFYDYSSGQNVPAKKGEPPPKTLSLHLFFILDRGVTSEEWRRYFKSNPHVDCKLYNPVQPHFTSLPKFYDIDDPLGDKRCGILE